MGPDSWAIVFQFIAKSIFGRLALRNIWLINVYTIKVAQSAYDTLLFYDWKLKDKTMNVFFLISIRKAIESREYDIFTLLINRLDSFAQ